MSGVRGSKRESSGCTDHLLLVVVIVSSENEVDLGHLLSQTTVVVPPHVSHCHHQITPLHTQSTHSLTLLTHSIVHNHIHVRTIRVYMYVRTHCTVRAT